VLGQDAGSLFYDVVRQGQAPDEALQRCDPRGILVIALVRAVEQRGGPREEMGFPIGEHGRGDLMLTTAFGAALGA
jgi:hypothetical protein